MKDLIARPVSFTSLTREQSEHFLTQEWLLTNGLGGYASGTIGGPVSRRYHGLLIAALSASLGRTVMLNHLAEFVRLPDGRRLLLNGDQQQGSAVGCLKEFRVELGLPVWTFELGEVVIEKRVLLVYGQNTVHVSYHLLSGGEGIELELHPSVQFRPHENDVDAPLLPYTISILDRRYEISSAGGPYPPLRLAVSPAGGTFTHNGGETREVFYPKESERGYRSWGVLWCPGFFTLRLSAKHESVLTASTEEWSTLRALTPARARVLEIERRHHLLALAEGRDPVLAELVLAADQFLFYPAGRVEDTARARASGDEVRTVIAGYHWFTDWGRDTMISLEGLTLSTGRQVEAGWILRTFAHYIRYGLIPNMFPEGENEGLYHTADATLWFFHAVDRYMRVTGDRHTLDKILPQLLGVIEHHEKGTKFHIRVDPADGLLSQGEEGYQLTWMDAKVDGWVVTPRRGKAVEINALWYNALRLTEGWLREKGDESAADQFAAKADRVRASFNRRFWNAATGYLFDVVDGEAGDDAACRPNQIFSISLSHPVLEESRWPDVLKVVEEKLLTPVGLRSLSEDHPDFKARYYGDLRARDAAYHQGTVWGWLIGPWVDAWLKAHPGDLAGARKFLLGLVDHLSEACVGSMSEVFDAEAPFHPRGCIAQAWSVAEVLRCWKKTEPGGAGTPHPAMPV